MTKFYILFFVLVFTLGYSQDYSFETIYQGTIETNALAKKHKIKGELCYEYKNESSKNGNFSYKKQFTSEGLLYKSRWLDKEKNKFVDTQYDYDSTRRIIKIKNEISSLVYDLELIQPIYSNDGKLSKLLHYYGPKDFVVFDTLTYNYDALNKTTFKVFHFRHEGLWLNDTIHYYYDSLGVLEYMKKIKGETHKVGVPIGIIIGGLVLWYVIPIKTIVDKEYFVNTESCKTKIDYPKKNYIEIKRDSLCNMVEWRKMKNTRTDWFISEEGFQSFNKQNLRIEEKIFRCTNLILSNCNNEPDFYRHIKYDYDEKGLPNKTLWMKENGKIKTVIRTTYEFH